MQYKSTDVLKMMLYIILFLTLTLAGDWIIRYLRYSLGIASMPQYLPMFFRDDYLALLAYVLIVSIITILYTVKGNESWKPVLIGTILMFSLILSMVVFSSPNGFMMLMQGDWKNVAYYTTLFAVSGLSILVGIEVSLRGFQFMKLRRRTE